MNLLEYFFKGEHESKLLTGRKIMQDEKGLDYLVLLASKLAKTPLRPFKAIHLIDEEKVSIGRFQFINQRQLFLKLNEAVLLAFSHKRRRIKIGLPKEYLNTLEKEGFRANTLQNRFRWLLFGFTWFLYGNFKWLEYLYDYTKIRRTPRTTKYTFDYFHNLTRNNLPNEHDGFSKSIIEWYVENFSSSASENICHSVKEVKNKRIGKKRIEYVTHPFIFSFNLSIYLFFFKWYVIINLISLRELLSGNLTYTLLIKEFPYLLQAINSKKEKLPQRIFFHNTSASFRPLWTYTLEEKGVEVVLYFYSTNNIVFKSQQGKYYPELYNKGYMNWPNYMVWDSHQKDFLDYTLLKKNYNTKIVGPIAFESKRVFKKNITDKRNIISIFEVNTFSDEYHAKIGHPSDYYIPPTLLQFHQDIHEVISSNQNFIGYMKRKREDHKIHKGYLNEINNLFTKENFKQIDVNTDAESLILNSFAVISIPFTSPAIIAKHHGIPSIYYDPIGCVQPDDRGLGSIPLIQHKKNLVNWFQSLIR